MTQISYASTEVELSNKKKYPRFFRTCAVDTYQAIALAEMVDHFNWRRVSIKLRHNTLMSVVYSFSNRSFPV